MLNNINNWGKKESFFLVYLECSLRNAYLCGRFKNKGSDIQTFLCIRPEIVIPGGCMNVSQIVLTKTIMHEIC